MPLTTQIRHALALSLLAALPAVADTIYQTAGTESVCCQYAINTSEAIAISWTSTVGYSNVSIVVSLNDGSNDTDVFEAGEAFLLDSIGPGSTEADVLANATFDFPPGPQDQELFSGLDLNPGTYYLLLDSSSSVGGGWQATETPDGQLTVTTSPGVASNGDFYSLAVNQTFAPNSSFTSGLVYEPLVNVTGTLATPEPASGVLFVISIFAFAAYSLTRPPFAYLPQRAELNLHRL